MLVRLASLASRSRISLRVMSSTSQNIGTPEKRSLEETQPPTENSESTPQNQDSKESAPVQLTAAAKRIKTAKDRKEHFDKKMSWKARDWSAGGKKPVRDGPPPERKPKKKVAVLVGFCGTGYQGMQM